LLAVEFWVMKKALITGSAGLIGSEAVKFLAEKDYEIIGIDNNMRAYFFGKEASTNWKKESLEEEYKNQYHHYPIDIRDDNSIKNIFNKYKRFDIIIHAAAQPSHDWAAKEPQTDFSINAAGTLVMLENYRKYSPNATFIFTSTNKVYGDSPNKLPLIEKNTRYELPTTHSLYKGIDESMTIDNSKHSIFGASKVAADILVQEYGKYFNLPTGIFRGGCLTGPAHSGTQLHGFLAYLIKSIATGRRYSIFGYRGKQVRDNIHSFDLVNMFWHFHQNPRPGEVYNAGGSRHANISILEAIKKVETIFKTESNIEYKKNAREGDHIWYISDVSKFKKHYPDWNYQYNIDRTIEEICMSGHFSNLSIGSSTYTFFQRSSIKAKKMGTTLLAAHTTSAFGAVQAFRLYFSTVSKQLILFEHSLFKTESNPLSALKDIYINITWFLKHKNQIKYFIAVNPINALSGVFLKLLGNTFNLIYYTDDYSKKRYNNFFFNILYHLGDFISVKFADVVWSSTPEILKIRQAMGLPKDRNILLRAGIYSKNQVKKKIDVKSDKNALVIDGFLSPQLSLITLVVEVFKKQVKKMPRLHLYIIVGHLDRKKLAELIKKDEIQKQVSFIENVPHQKSISNYKSYGIGLAVVEVSDRTPAMFRDPVEIKELLAAGVPVICSKGYNISLEIEKNKMGFSINNTKSELNQALTKILSSPQLHHQFSSNALKYTRNLTWDIIFETILKKSGIINYDIQHK